MPTIVKSPSALESLTDLKATLSISTCFLIFSPACFSPAFFSPACLACVSFDVVLPFFTNCLISSFRVATILGFNILAKPISNFFILLSVSSSPPSSISAASRSSYAQEIIFSVSTCLLKVSKSCCSTASLIRFNE